MFPVIAGRRSTVHELCYGGFVYYSTSVVPGKFDWRTIPVCTLLEQRTTYPTARIRLGREGLGSLQRQSILSFPLIPEEAKASCRWR